jgi:hypothetical protein
MRTRIAYKGIQEGPPKLHLQYKWPRWAEPTHGPERDENASFFLCDVGEAFPN